MWRDTAYATLPHAAAAGKGDSSSVDTAVCRGGG